MCEQNPWKKGTQQQGSSAWRYHSKIELFVGLFMIISTTLASIIVITLAYSNRKTASGFNSMSITVRPSATPVTLTLSQDDLIASNGGSFEIQHQTQAHSDAADLVSFNAVIVAQQEESQLQKQYGGSAQALRNVSDGEQDQGVQIQLVQDESTLGEQQEQDQQEEEQSTQKEYKGEDGDFVSWEYEGVEDDEGVYAR